MESLTFHLNEFKETAKWIDKYTPYPLNIFLKGWLKGLEELYIGAKVSSSVEKAIADYRRSQPPLVNPPNFYEEESEVEGLPIIGYETRRTRQEDAR